MIKRMLKCSWLVIAICAAITVFFGWQLKNIKIENTSRTFMPKDDESYQFMLKTEKDFGSMLALGILLETRGDSILSPEYIGIIQKITDRITEIEFVESVDSLTNIDYIFGEVSEDGEGTLRANSLLGEDGEYTGSQEDMRMIKRKIIDWEEMYNRVVVNDSFTAAQLVVSLTASDETGEELSSAVQNSILAAIQKVCDEELEGSSLAVRYYGDPVMSHDARDFLISDLVKLIPFVAIIVLLSLYFSFHTWSGTLLPLVTVLVSTVWSVGILSFLKLPFTIIGSMIPVCLIACGSAYGIHVMTHYYIGLDRIQGEVTKENHAGAIEFALKDVWIAVLLASITTIAGFISNVSSPLRPLRSFSVFAASGVAFSLILSVTLIPAILYITPLKTVGKHWKNKNHLTAKIKMRLEKELLRRGGKSATEAQGHTLYSIYHFFAGTRPRLIVFMMMIVLLSVVGLKKLLVDTAMVNYFPETSKFRQDLAYVDDRLAGTNSMFLVVQGNEFTEEELLAYEQSSSSDSASSDFDFGGTDFDFAGSDFDFGDGSASAASDFDFGGASDSSGGDFDFGESSENEKPKKYHSLTNPEILKAVDDMQNYLELHHSDEIGKIISFTTFIKRMNQVMHVPVGNEAGTYAAALNKNVSMQELLSMLSDAYAAAGGEGSNANKVVYELEKRLNYAGLGYYEIPYDVSKYPVASREELSDLVTQYLYLLSSDKITNFADDMTNPKAIRIQIQLKSHSTVETGKLIDEIDDYVKKYFPKGYTVTPTGAATLENTMSHLVINSQMVSIVFSLVMVFIIIALSFKSGWAGLIGAIPLGLVILLNFMVMGFAGIRLDLCTSIVSSIAIGVGIDYTIHFMETYRTERQRIYKVELELNAERVKELSGDGTVPLSAEKAASLIKKMSGGMAADLEEVARRTFNTSGKGIVTNALAVGLGFFVLILSRFIILRYIGILVAVVMFTSSMLSMTIIPGLLNAFDPKFMWSKEEKEAYKAKIVEKSE